MRWTNNNDYILRAAPDGRIAEPQYTEDLLPVNEKTRSGIKLERKTGLCVHYAGSPGATYPQLRRFFKNLHHRFASYHWVIDQHGAIYNIIPTDECAWHGGPTPKTRPEITELLGGRPNWSTEGICYLHNDASGSLTQETWGALVHLVAWRQQETGVAHIHRHYDYTRKECPRYMVKNHDEWERFKEQVAKR